MLEFLQSFSSANCQIAGLIQGIRGPAVVHNAVIGSSGAAWHLLPLSLAMKENPEGLQLLSQV